MPRVKKNKSEEIQAPAEETAAEVKQEQKEENAVDDSPIVVYGTTVTANQLKKYKEQFKKVYFTDFAGQFFIWRRLNRAEFTSIFNETESIEDSNQQADLREQKICQAAILYPDQDVLQDLMDSDDVMTSRISDEILYKSGFFRPQTVEL